MTTHWLSGQSKLTGCGIRWVDDDWKLLVESISRNAADVSCHMCLVNGGPAVIAELKNEIRELKAALAGSQEAMECLVRELNDAREERDRYMAEQAKEATAIVMRKLSEEQKQRAREAIREMSGVLPTCTGCLRCCEHCSALVRGRAELATSSVPLPQDGTMPPHEEAQGQAHQEPVSSQGTPPDGDHNGGRGKGVG